MLPPDETDSEKAKSSDGEKVKVISGVVAGSILVICVLIIVTLTLVIAKQRLNRKEYNVHVSYSKSSGKSTTIENIYIKQSS